MISQSYKMYQYKILKAITNPEPTQINVLIRVGSKLNRQLMMLWLILGTHKNFFQENQTIFLLWTMSVATIMPSQP